MNRRQKIIVSVVGIFLVLLILVGLTYAYFLTKIQGNTKSTSITVKTANLALVYGDGNGVIEPTDAIMPGDIIASKTFTVTNNGDSTVNDYVVVLENVYNELVRPKDLVYTVECTSSDDKTCNGVNTETQFPSGKGSVGAGEGFGIVVTNSIDKDVVHTYTITLKYLNVDVDQSDDMNKTIQGKINIKDGNEINPYKSQEGTLANAIINNAVNLTSEQKSLGYAEFRTTPLTTPAVEISSENESEITMANDDYGVSYYYRGNVENNYIEFNNMCWRIVRIEGDGSVKITLAAQKKCSEITDSDTGTAFIGTASYGYKTDSNGYYIADYINSTTGMRSKLNTWLDSSGIDKTKLKQDTWCIGNMKDAYDYSGTGEIIGTVSDMIASNTNFNYSNYNRIYTTKTPSLRCETTGTDGEVDTNYIGALTIDEIVYAGGKISNNNQKYYLNKNATSDYWWSLSPSDFNGGGDRAVSVKSNGYVIYNNLSYNLSVRPTVSLKTGTVITSGDGTQENPYIVN